MKKHDRKWSHMETLIEKDCILIIITMIDVETFIEKGLVSQHRYKRITGRNIDWKNRMLVGTLVKNDH